MTVLYIRRFSCQSFFAYRSDFFIALQHGYAASESLDKKDGHFYNMQSIVTILFYVRLRKWNRNGK